MPNPRGTSNDDDDNDTRDPHLRASGSSELGSTSLNSDDDAAESDNENPGGLPAVRPVIQSRARIIEAGPSDAGLITGPMGGCVSIFLFWDWDEDAGKFNGMLGHHASGGGSDLAWRSYAKAIPEQFRDNVQQIILCAEAQTDIEATMRNLDGCRIYFPRAPIYHHLGANWVVLKNVEARQVTEQVGNTCTAGGTDYFIVDAHTLGRFEL